MEEFEFEIKRMMSGEPPADAAKVKHLGDEVVRAFERKRRKVKTIFWVFYLLAFAVGLFFLIVLSLLQLFPTEASRFSLLCAVIVLDMSGSCILMKLWYWIMDSKIASVRELKLVQLQLAELAAKVNERPGEK